MPHLIFLLYPELRSLPEGDRRPALHAARRTEFDAIELGGMAVGLLLTTALARYDGAGGAAAPLLGFPAHFLLALPFAAVLIGPFFVRRTRRGLRHYIERHVESRAEP